MYGLQSRIIWSWRHLKTGYSTHNLCTLQLHCVGVKILQFLLEGRKKGIKTSYNFKKLAILTASVTLQAGGVAWVPFPVSSHLSMTLRPHFEQIPFVLNLSVSVWKEYKQKGLDMYTADIVPLTKCIYFSLS